MTYEYVCSRCETHQEVQHLMTECDVPRGCACGGELRRWIGVPNVSIPRAFKWDGDYIGRGMDNADKKAVIEADLKQYEKNWDGKTPSKPSKKKTSMAELSKQFKGMVPK